jgi:hypothetical protein
MVTGSDMEMRWQTELYDSRKRLQMELKKALLCTKKREKIELAARWKREYSENFYKELIRCAKNKSVAGDIIEWNLDEFDNKKTR